MPSISPVHTVMVSEEETQPEKQASTNTPPPRRTRSDSSSSESSPTFGERLKAARKLIPSYPGRAKLESSPNGKEKSTKSTNGYSTSRDFRAILREHMILME